MGKVTNYDAEGFRNLITDLEDDHDGTPCSVCTVCRLIAVPGNVDPKKKKEKLRGVLQSATDFDYLWEFRRRR